MIGVLVNVAAILMGGTVGLVLKKGIPEKVSKAVMTAVGLCIAYIGIDSALEGKNPIVLIVSVVLGTLVGSLIDIDGKLESLGGFIEKRLSKKEGKELNITRGFVTSSLLFCVGAMAIIGSFNAGLKGDNSVLFTKSLLDMISACMFASTLGVGVLFSAVPILLYQGGLVLLAGLLQQYLTDPVLIAELSCAGGIMIIGLALNMMGITKIKIANLLPGLAFVPLVNWLVGLLPSFN